MVDLASLGEVGALTLLVYELRRVESALLLIARQSDGVDNKSVRKNLGLARNPVEEEE